MGCCFSTPDGPNSPYPAANNAHSASARAINVPAPGDASGSSGGGPSSSSRAAGGSSARSARAGASNSDGAGAESTSSSSNNSTPSTIASQHLLRAGLAASGSAGAASHQHQQADKALAKHLNKPLVRRRWTSRNRVWTRHAIDQERQDFFDTRVTGRAEIWQTLHTVLEILWEADLVDATAVTGASSSTTAAFRTPIGVADAAVGVATHSPAEGSADHDASEARATAQSILDAADITLPTGDMAQGAYDAFGNFYALPAWIVSDPTNLDDDPEHELDEAKGALYDDDYEDDEEDGDAADEADDHGEAAEAGPTGATVESAAEAGGAGERSAREKQDSPQTPTSATATTVTNTTSRRRREEKGKGIVVAANQIVVRARLSSASTRDVVIHLGREETVRSLVHRISEGAKLPHRTRIRIAYLGKILKDSASLTAQGWKEGDVVNALVFEDTA